MEMHRETILKLFRAGFGLLALGTIVYQIINLSNRDEFHAVNFFSFFTIESNLIALAVLLYLSVRGSTEPEHQGRLDLIRGAAVLYMVTTGIIYDQLLSGYTKELQTAVIWVDNVVHRQMPVVMVIDWLADPPKSILTYRKAVVWVVFPLAYVVYSLIRGPIANWYPYPFMDPDRAGGYLGVLAYSLVMAVGIFAMVWVIVRLGEWRRREDARAAA